ncbi:MAG: four helix bundle suffix domain-containing protein, partial [Sodaliphilus sp.]|nr:four helix bundle suffix domain-containing protein [Sodaliphilus sp.]
KIRSDETVANIAIILIHQADTLLKKLINRQKQDFLQQGGIREQMSQARIAHRTKKNKIPPSK